MVQLVAVALAATGVLSAASGPAHATLRSVPAAASVPRLTWSMPVTLEKAPFANGGNLVSVSCASVNFCAASDVFGNVVTSGDPAGGSAAWSAATPVAPLQYRQLALSCPSARFCAARQYRTIYTSSSPGGTRPAWRKSYTYREPIGAIQCPRMNLCLAVSGGKVIISTDPAARRPSWHVVSPARPISYPSCPSASFCAALAGGDVLTSSHPAAGRGAWKITNVDGAARLFNLACSSASFCLAMDSLGRVAYSTDPAGGAGRWHFSAGVPSDADLFAVSCPSPTLCVARDRTNGLMVAATTHPTNGSLPWQETGVNGKSIEGLSCVKPSFCAVATNYGLVASSSSLAFPSPHWTSANVDGSTQVTDVACASAKLCLAADGAGRTFTSVDPTGGAGAWRSSYIDGANLISSINCPAVSFCAAIGSDGNLLTSTDPAGGVAADWQKISVPSGLSELSCQAKGFCAGVDGAGLLTSTDPAGGASSWQQATAPANLAHLSCPSAKLCAAVVSGHDNELVTTTDPAAASPQFTTTTFSSYQIYSLRCPTTSLCVAVGEDQPDHLVFLSSTRPAAGITAWHVSRAPAIALLACPNAAECIVIKYIPYGAKPGAMFTTTDPAAVAPRWRESPAPINLVTVSCPTVSICVGGYQPNVGGGVASAVPAKAKSQATVRQRAGWAPGG
ncbi:MAG: hypothetical protein ACLQFR_09755 [Streptosporangiaceae bacterium]